MERCLCGNSQPYAKCCGAIHSRTKSATTAEELMRSRYSAFVLANGEYLIETHASSTRHTVDKDDIEKWAKSVKWIKLEIVETTKGQAEDQVGTVEFIATYKQSLFRRSIHERSEFIRENGKWVYLKGAHQ